MRPLGTVRSVWRGWCSPSGRGVVFTLGWGGDVKLAIVPSSEDPILGRARLTSLPTPASAVGGPQATLGLISFQKDSESLQSCAHSYGL